jgi:hypothetical protein
MADSAPVGQNRIVANGTEGLSRHASPRLRSPVFLDGRRLRLGAPWITKRAGFANSGFFVPLGVRPSPRRIKTTRESCPTCCSPTCGVAACELCCRMREYPKPKPCSSNHETRSMLERYNIVSLKNLRRTQEQSCTPGAASRKMLSRCRVRPPKQVPPRISENDRSDALKAKNKAGDDRRKICFVTCFGKTTGNLAFQAIAGKYKIPNDMLVRMRGLEPPRPCEH